MNARSTNGKIVRMVANSWASCVHIEELRGALAAVYERAGITPPTYTDAALVPGLTTIKVEMTFFSAGAEAFFAILGFVLGGGAVALSRFINSGYFALLAFAASPRWLDSSTAFGGSTHCGV